MSTDYHHYHDHDTHDEIPFNEKLERIIRHWVKHNEDHASNYRNWAKNAKANGKEKAAKFLEEAAEMSLTVNEKFEAALAALD